MAPKGDLIETLARTTDRAIWIKDWKEVGLNLLDLNADLLIYVFESLLESEPTPKQKAFLSLCAQKAKSLPELRALVRRPDPDYKETAQQIEWRLDLLRNPVIEGVFSRPTNIDVLRAMNEGHALLIDTSIATLGESGSSFVGRFIIALIALAANKKTPRPCYVYIDECATYLTEYIESLLDRAREMNVCLTLAHQHLAQLSPRLKQSVHNTATKFVGRCNHSDAVEMAHQISIDPQLLKNLPRLTFYLSGVSRPFPIKIIPGQINQLATEHTEHFTSPPPPSPPPKSDDDEWV